jgi:G3E family GTPase
MDAFPHAVPIPVLLVAGALGAGKTTLVARWISEPGFAASAVLLNELGEGAIDAHLVGGYMSATRTLCGCACCAARGMLAGALGSLVDADATRFERAIVELAGIADPLPVIDELEGDSASCERFPLHGLAVVIDATEGEHALEGPHSPRCAAVADVLVVAKTEHADAAAIDRLEARLAAVNPDAELVRAGPDGCNARDVWQAAAASPRRALRRLESRMAGSSAHDVEVHTLHLPPVELSGFCMRLAAFLEARPGAVLRAKGLVGVKGRRGPAVIQAVGGALHPVRTLKEWPPGAAPGTLRIVTRGVGSAVIRAALA